VARKKLKKFSLLVGVTRATGHQVYELEASSKEDAVARFNQGEGHCIHEELEVESLEEVDIDEVEEVEE
jgi:hypothetical protein